MSLMPLKLIFTSKPFLVWTVWQVAFPWPLMLVHVSPARRRQHEDEQGERWVSVSVPDCGMLTQFD